MPLERTKPRPRFFAGWWMVVAIVLIQGVGYGTSSWAFGAYFIPLEESFGWSRAEVSGALAIAALVAGLGAPLVGKLADSQGVRRLMLIGMLITAAGFAVLYGMSGLWQLYLGNLIIAIGRAGVTGIPVNILIGAWFVRRRMVALGIAWTGGPLGGVALVPLTTYWIESYGWRHTYLILGVILVAVIAPLALWLVKNKPADAGLLPDGAETAVVAASAGRPARAPRKAPPVEMDWTTRLAFRSPAFWYVALSFCLVYFSYYAVVQHLLPFLRSQGSSAQMAGAIVGASAFLTVIGRVIAGILAGRFSVGRVLVGYFLVQAAGLGIVTVAAGNPWAIATMVLLHSLAGGGLATLEPAMVMERFGTRGLGLLLGLVDFIRVGGMASGPLVAGYIFDATRSYTIAFAIFALAYVGGTVFLPLIRPGRQEVRGVEPVPRGTG